MEGIVIFIILLGLWLLIAPIVAMVKAADAKASVEQAKADFEKALARIGKLETELERLGSTRFESQSITPASAADRPSIPPPRPPKPAETAIPGPVENPALEEVLQRVLREEQRIAAKEKTVVSILPPLPEPAGRNAEKEPVLSPLQQEPAEPFSLEKFLGVKLFAWLGGVALFFGVILFVKYAFENNLVPPAARIVMGFVTGTGLVVAGMLTHRRERYRVLAQAFCATGVLILYGVTFAAHAVYHFSWFGTVQTFVLMAGITFGAFLLAVRLNALVVAALGMLGGFLTPELLATSRDQPLALFGYIALLDIGLLAVSRHGRWRALTGWAAAGTALIQARWFSRFFDSGNYDTGAATWVPMGILLFFTVLFLAGGWLGRKRIMAHAAGASLGMAAMAVLFVFLMLGEDAVAQRQVLLYGFLFLVQLPILAVVFVRPAFGIAQPPAAVLVFLHLALWTGARVNADNLAVTLGLYLVFGALHAVAAVVLSRRPAAVAPGLVPWHGPVLVAMMIVPLLSLSPVPMLLWAGVLIGNLMGIVLAVTRREVRPVLASLAITMAAIGIWLWKLPEDMDSLTPFLVVVTGFSTLFAVAGGWMARASAGDEGVSPHQEPAAMQPLSAILPILLLILALNRLPVPEPSLIFGAALLLAALLCGLSLFGRQGPLSLVALGGIFAVEVAWRLANPIPSPPGVLLGWYVGFHLLFLAFPFVFRKASSGRPAVWIAAALSGVAQFPLVYDLVKSALPNEWMGLVPAAFAIPSLAAFFAAWRGFPEMDGPQRSRLAWLGGVALLFITLIFPIQFERQWLTVSWAIEGALLIWLFRRVPHPGLWMTGGVLLATVFVRLTLNMAVFTSYVRDSTPILNWHLYTYGLVAAAQFAGARWLTDAANPRFRALLYTMGGILLFLLLNIQIGDYFTPQGSRHVAFDFGGNFARDMTYTIGWGLFSLGLLAIGFRTGSKHARFAAVGLLAATLLKLFLHDLAAIQNIFRIGALIGVAVIAFAASFLYQRFFDKSSE